MTRIVFYCSTYRGDVALSPSCVRLFVHGPLHVFQLATQILRLFIYGPHALHRRQCGNVTNSAPNTSKRASGLGQTVRDPFRSRRPAPAHLHKLKAEFMAKHIYIFHVTHLQDHTDAFTTRSHSAKRAAAASRCACRPNA